MNDKRVQRYRLTMEFVLRDRGDYGLVRALFRHVLLDAAEHFIGVIVDDVEFEKVIKKEE